MSFPSTKGRMSFSISCSTHHWGKILVAFFCLKYVCILILSLKGVFVGCGILGWQFIFWNCHLFLFMISSSLWKVRVSSIIKIMLFLNPQAIRAWILLTSFPLVLSHIFLLLYISSNFGSHRGYCGWHIVDTKDSVIFFWRVLSFLLAGSSITDWSPLGRISFVFISLQSKGLLRVFSSTTIQKHQFFSAQFSLWSNCHIHTWLLEKP